MKSPRTFPRLVMKEWPARAPAPDGADGPFAPTEDDVVSALMFEKRRINQEHREKALSDFTRVVDQTDPEARKEARQSKMHHDRAPTK